jgi:hypothetical protein
MNFESPMKIISLLFISLILSGCSSLEPLHTIPPHQTLILEKPYISKDALQTLTLPKGTYEATMEDSKGYYYAAPAKLIGHDILGNYLLEGGIFQDKIKATNYSAYYASPQSGITCKWKLWPDFQPKPGP